MDLIQPKARGTQPATLLARFFRSALTLLRSVKVRRRERSFRICETLPLGEKRFLAVVQFEQRRYLIGATPQSISLLQCLSDLSRSTHGQTNTLDSAMWDRMR